MFVQCSLNEAFQWGYCLFFFSSHELESVDLSTHSFSFFSAILFSLSYNCFSIDLLSLNLFLVDFFDFS